MKKITFALVSALALTTLFTGCEKKEKTIKIGIAKIVQHPALDSIEEGIQDRLAERGIKASYNLQNANGDVGTAAQIANLYASENVDVAVGIATPVAVALATVIKEKPVVFSCITDPVGAGLVTDLSRGENNVTGLSDAIPTQSHIKIFKEIAGIKTLGYIYTSSEANSISALEEVKKACEANGVALVSQSISKSDEVKQAAQAIINRVDGLYLTTDNTVFSALSAVIEVFNKAHKPIFSGDVTGAKTGGIFMASGFNYYKAGKATGDMIYEILEGKKPSEMPVKFITDPSESDLLFDIDVASDCNITIPEDYLEKANMIFKDGVLTEK